MRMAIVGVGVIGSYFGGRLAHAGEDVVFLARGANLRAIREHGLRVDSVDGDFVVRPAQVTDDPTTVGLVDVVLLTVKGWQVAGAIETMRPLMGPDTLAVALSDGVEAPGQLADAFGEGRAGGIAVMLGTAVAPGHIRNVLPKTTITFGELNAHRSERVVRLPHAFERAGIVANMSPDIVSDRWRKLLLVGPWSGVGAATRAPLAVVRTVPETSRPLEEAMREVVAVARARGASMADDAMKQALASLDRDAATSAGNMLRDIAAGRLSELETEIGAIVRLAGVVGVEVLCHAFLYASLLPQERKARGEIEFPGPPARPVVP